MSLIMKEILILKLNVQQKNAQNKENPELHQHFNVELIEGYL